MTPEEEVELQARRRAALLRDPTVQRAAARMRVTVDQRLGDETPQWIVDLAGEERDPRAVPSQRRAPRPPRAGTRSWWRRQRRR